MFELRGVIVIIPIRNPIIFYEQRKVHIPWVHQPTSDPLLRWIRFHHRSKVRQFIGPIDHTGESSAGIVWINEFMYTPISKFNVLKKISKAILFWKILDLVSIHPWSAPSFGICSSLVSYFHIHDIPTIAILDPTWQFFIIRSPYVSGGRFLVVGGSNSIAAIHISIENNYGHPLNN